MAAVAGPGAPLVAWLAGELERLGVPVALQVGDWSAAPGEVVLQCTGSRRGIPPYEVVDDATVLDVADVRANLSPLPADGEVVLLDPIGGPIAVALAAELGERAILVTQDLIAGNELSRTGDLAPANVRLQQRGVRIERRSVVRAVRRAAEGLDGLEVDVDDRFTGRRRTITCAAVVDCGFRLPDDPLPGAFARAGDCVAPRTILEAVLEGRRAAYAV
jgi:hypothetical protein